MEFLSGFMHFEQPQGMEAKQIGSGRLIDDPMGSHMRREGKDSIRMFQGACQQGSLSMV
jgi:hypothetical protein